MNPSHGIGYTSPSAPGAFTAFPLMGVLTCCPAPYAHLTVLGPVMSSSLDLSAYRAFTVIPSVKCISGVAADLTFTSLPDMRIVSCLATPYAFAAIPVVPLVSGRTTLRTFAAIPLVLVASRLSALRTFLAVL